MSKDHTISGPTYFWVLVVLLALTLLSWGLSHVALGPLATPVGMGIAFVKATLVALYFMHLRHARVSLQLIIVVTFLFIVLLTLGMISDVALR